MATASTGILFNATAINKTSRVFRQITQSALSVGKKIATVGAGFAVGGAAAIAATAKSLGHLSDVAMQAGVSTEEITKMSGAMDVLGIKSSTPEQLAMAFQRMAKTTGETGVAGFEKVIGEISQLGTVEERASAAMATFGKSGMDFLPLIEAAAQNGTSALHNVIAAMPGVSDAAAQAGDAAADAMTTVTNGIKAAWGETVGSIVEWMNGQFEGGIRGAAVNAAAYLKYGAALAFRWVKASLENIAKAYHAMSADWGETFSQLWRALVKGAYSAGKLIIDVVVNIGRVIRDFLKEVWSGLSGDGFDWNRVVANANFKGAWDEFKNGLSEAANEVTIFDGVEWSRVDTSDLEKKLKDSLVEPAKFAADVGKAAVGISANVAAEKTAEQVQTAAKAAANTDLLQANTYRAATMSLRADYGKGEDKTVRAVNAVKSVNEKIQKATESTAAALSNLENLG